METMDTSTTQPANADARQTTLSLLLGIVVWFLHQNIVYGVASLTCRWGWLTFNIAGVRALPVVEALITLVALLLLLRLFYLPWRIWRKYQSEKPPDNPRLLQDTEKDGPPLLAFVAMLTNSLFCLFVL